MLLRNIRLSSIFFNQRILISDAHHSLKLQSGILIAVPIPLENSADGEKIELAIQTALEEAE